MKTYTPATPLGHALQIDTESKGRVSFKDLVMTERSRAFFAEDSDKIAALVAALESATAQFDSIASALAQGHTVSISSVQNCAAMARSAAELHR